MDGDGHGHDKAAAAAQCSDANRNPRDSPTRGKIQDTAAVYILHGTTEGSNREWEALFCIFLLDKITILPLSTSNNPKECCTPHRTSMLEDDDACA